MYLDTRDHSPVRKPDQPFNEMLIQSPQKCKKERVTKIRVDRTQSFKHGGSVGKRFRPCSLAQPGTFDAVKKKAKFLEKKLLVSLYNERDSVCTRQNADIWSSSRFAELSAKLLFFQLRVDSEEGIEFVRMYHQGQAPQLPHAALVEPQTGVLLAKWVELDMLDLLERELGAVGVVGASESAKNPRKRQLLIDQDEDEQIAIALAASLKQAKRRLVERDDSDVEYNSDFESVHSNDELTFDDNDDDDVDEHKSGRVKGEEEESNQNQPIRSCDLGAPISISIRAPDGSRFTIEQLRENSDASELMRRLEDKGYSCVQYELIRAYPRQKLDLSAGNALSDLNIKNQDAFHVQLKM